MHVILFVLLLALAFRLLFRTPLVDKFLPLYSYLTMTQDRLYRLLSVIKETFARYDIPWAITGTTLLGAVTIQNFMHKDTTIHVVVPAEYLPQIISLTDQLYKQLGLGVQDLPDGGIRIGGAFALPFMDSSSVHIHGIQKVGDRWQSFSKTLLDERYGENELFPTKMYVMGALDVPGPRDPIDYIRRNFGPNATTAFAARAVRELRVPVAKYRGRFVLLDDIPTFDVDRQVVPNAVPLIPTSRYGLLDLQNSFKRGTLRNRFPRGSKVMAPIVGSLI